MRRFEPGSLPQFYCYAKTMTFLRTSANSHQINVALEKQCIRNHCFSKVHSFCHLHINAREFLPNLHFRHLPALRVQPFAKYHFQQTKHFVIVPCLRRRYDNNVVVIA